MQYICMVCKERATEALFFLLKFSYMHEYYVHDQVFCICNIYTHVIYFHFRKTNFESIKIAVRN
jgi:hypothetical protein